MYKYNHTRILHINSANNARLFQCFVERPPTSVVEQINTAPEDGLGRRGYTPGETDSVGTVKNSITISLPCKLCPENATGTFCVTDKEKRSVGLAVGNNVADTHCCRAHKDQRAGHNSEIL